MQSEREEAMPEPAAARVAEAAEEPSLFGSMNAEREAAEEQMETIFERQEPQSEDVMDEDGLPAPAYRPQVAEFSPSEDSIEADPEQFVAPRAPAPGTPSADALARLQAAAARARPNPHAAPADAEPADADRPRFGINSLINRMTGQQGQEAPVRRTGQPPVQSSAAAPAPEPEADADQERIEIPAFLRRQAN